MCNPKPNATRNAVFIPCQNYIYTKTIYLSTLAKAKPLNFERYSRRSLCDITRCPSSCELCVGRCRDSLSATTHAKSLHREDQGLT